MMATVGRNILANVAGTGLAMAVFVVVVPIYLRLLGAEAYGLVGLFTTVMVASMALDRKSTRLNSSHQSTSRMPSSA